MYDEVAHRWHDDIVARGTLQAYEMLLREICRLGLLGHLPQGAKTLEAGIGTGALGLAVLRAESKIESLVGIDLSVEMLNRAKQNLDALSATRQITLLRSDMCSMPFQEATFDLVLAAHSVEHCGNPMTALKELSRVLRPGAPLVVVSTRSAPWNFLHAQKWHYFIPAKGQLERQMASIGLKDITRIPIKYPKLSLLPQSECYVGMKADGKYRPDPGIFYPPIEGAC